ALLATCAGKSFLERRDAAIIRLLMDTGARLSEITLLNVDDVDLKRDLDLVRGKGAGNAAPLRPQRRRDPRPAGAQRPQPREPSVKGLMHREQAGRVDAQGPRLGGGAGRGVRVVLPPAGVRPARGRGCGH